MERDTIAAISTAVSESGIGIIRISGDNAFSVIDNVYRAKNNNKILSNEKSHTIHYGYIFDDDEMIDEVLVMIMRAPRTFTAEDTVEINCHGGVYAMKRVLEAVLHAGARPAEPGEFTKRAFLNGRIDLSQAEAVIDIIQAKNEYALKSSVSQLNGSILATIKDLRHDILYHIAFIESALDDPEHVSLDGYPKQLMDSVNEWIRRLDKLISSSENGRFIREGIKTVIVGKPNAGKSSLLNTLLGEERAIVTDIAGTTRDILTETLNLDGIILNIVDTAGIRETNDIVEKIGIKKAEDNAENADLVIYVADSSTDLDENDDKIIRLLSKKKSVVLLNKSDLKSVTTINQLKTRIKNLPVIPVSAKTGYGIDKFVAVIKDMFYKGYLLFNDEIFITNIRHKKLLDNARISLYQVQKSIRSHMPEDFFSIDLMDAYTALGMITGEQLGEDLVNEIFNKFCMGK